MTLGNVATLIQPRLRPGCRPQEGVREAASPLPPPLPGLDPRLRQGPVPGGITWIQGEEKNEREGSVLHIQAFPAGVRRAEQPERAAALGRAHVRLISHQFRGKM